MSNKNKKLGLGIAAVAVAGAGLVYAAQKTSQQKVKKIAKAAPPVDYRNTERGKYEKNSKGIYYTNGNYEAFARPRKPEGVDDKNAYIVGSGLAALATACFLVRDGQMPGSHIHILEAMDVAGGACDGIFDPTRGYVMRGGREMENHFECLWDLFRSIPSLEVEGASVLDEYYWLNKHDPNYSLCRASVNRGEDAHTDKQFKLDKESAMALSQLFITPEKDLEGKKIAVQATTKAEDLFLHKIASDLPQMGQVNCFSTTNELYAALRKNYVDAIAGHEAMLGSLVRDGEDAYRMLDESIYTSELGIAFKKGTHEEVAQELTETLEEMRNEGITEEIVKKYGLDADEILPGGKSK